MAFADPIPVRDRVRTAIVVAALHVALGYALIAGLSVELPHRVADRLMLFALVPPPPHPVPPPPRRRQAAASRREGSAAPSGLAARATPVVAPPPIVVPPVPLPVPAAPVAGAGAATHAGAAAVVGPGSGSGGTGEGTGSGGDGDGPGGGGGGRDIEFISGIRDKDYPRAAYVAGISGMVGVRFTVGVKGRVTDCVMTRSSGDATLDAATCPLILKRMRYRPRYDRAGRPVPTVVEGTHAWTLYGGPGDREHEEDR